MSEGKIDWTDVAAAEINNALQLGLSDREMRRIREIMARNLRKCSALASADRNGG